MHPRRKVVVIQFEPVPRPTSLTDLAYERLRSAILQGELLPATTISVVAMARALDMSRSPVRAAVERLAAEGLLTQSGSGAEVAVMTKQDLLGALQVRAPLEALAAELATPNLSPARLDDLTGIQQRFESAVAEGDSREARTADLEFHQCIHAASGNPLLVDILHRVHARIVVSTYVSAWRSSQAKAVGEHRQILDALLSADAAAASERSAHHILQARERASIHWDD